MDTGTALNGVISVLAMFGFLTAIILGPRWLKSRDRRELQQTLRLAMEKGQTLPPEVVEAITTDAKSPPSPERDLRGGVIWLAVGLGVAIFGWMVGLEENDAFYPIAGLASIPVLIGVALIVLSVLGRDRRA
jgi:hypothetical protein